MKEKLILKEVEQIIKKEPIEVGEVNGKKVIFNPNVSYQKVITFCQQMSDIVLSANGMYLPKLKDILVFAFMVENMTNIPVKKDKEGNYNIDFLYNLLSSDIGKKLLQKFKSDTTYYFLIQELKTVVSFKKDVYLKSISPYNKIFEKIEGLIMDAKNAMYDISSFYKEIKNVESEKDIPQQQVETINQNE